MPYSHVLQMCSGYRRWENWMHPVLLDKQFAREAFYNITVVTEFNKAVVLFGSSVSQRLEPMSVVGNIKGLCPILHAIGYHVGHFTIDRGTFLDCVLLLLYKPH